LIFNATSTAGSATITNNSGGTTFLVGTGNGGRFIMNGTGALDISQFTTNIAITAGSIEGDGNVFLGDHVLTVGGNNRSTTFSGVIQDGGAGGGIVGSLVKEGTGTLILSGTNIYTGATMVTAGTLEVDGSITTSNLATVNGGTLSGIGALTTTQGQQRHPGAGQCGQSDRRAWHQGQPHLPIRRALHDRHQRIDFGQHQCGRHRHAWRRHGAGCERQHRHARGQIHDLDDHQGRHCLRDVQLDTSHLRHVEGNAEL
jgi:autotransporter-associated beta strand protein